MKNEYGHVSVGLQLSRTRSIIDDELSSNPLNVQSLGYSFIT